MHACRATAHELPVLADDARQAASLLRETEVQMITLYHAPRSRSSRFIFLLEELGAPYEIKTVSIRRGDGSGAADSANPHPWRENPRLCCDDYAAR